MSSEAAPPAPPRPDADIAATFGAPRRLHVAAAVSGAVVALRGVAFPLVAAIVLGGSRGGMDRALLYGALGVAFALASGVVRWRTTTYRLSDGALRLRQGVFSPDDTLIPVARIHAIDTVQGPLQRAFGVLELHVQTPGGGSGGEIVLDAVAPPDARALRAAMGLAEPSAPSARRRLGPGALLATALTAPQFGVILPVVGAAFAGADDLFGTVVDEDAFRRIDSARRLAEVAVLLLAASFLISFLAAVVAFAGFEVERDGDRLSIRRGLFQRRAASLPVARIDGVAVVEGLLRAPFGLAAVRLEIAGYRGEAAAARTLFPLVRRREVAALLAELVPGLDGRVPLLERPPGRSRRRYLTVPTLVGVLIGGALGLAATGAGAGAPVAALAVGAGLGALAGAGQGALAFRDAGLHLGADRVVVRLRRGGARVTLLARRRRLQETSVRSGPLQRRAGLATFGLALGSGRRGRVRHLERAAADAALEALGPG